MLISFRHWIIVIGIEYENDLLSKFISKFFRFEDSGTFVEGDGVSLIYTFRVLGLVL